MVVMAVPIPMAALNMIAYRDADKRHRYEPVNVENPLPGVGKCQVDYWISAS